MSHNFGLFLGIFQTNNEYFPSEENQPFSPLSMRQQKKKKYYHKEQL